MSSPAASLSWMRSSSVLHCIGGGCSNEAPKLHERRAGLLVFAQKKTKKTRKIILKEDVELLGKKGELLDVRAGFYRNFLSPTGKAQIVTPLLLKNVIDISWHILSFSFVFTMHFKVHQVKEEAQQLALIFETVGAFKVKRKGGKGKQIFGTVTAQDLVDIIKAQLQREVDKRIVFVPEIRETGEYVAELKLHPEVTARVRINVFAN
ncbi:hypothetical protein SAY87_001868 [Trapa incisa]|uniref:Large ribosomal subunit protein bL9c n=1 Tax=Trapa incisa TaxID=236973 RepID=A0AAN7JVS3_9MYRT|nr:hypothetical protein SAY87_001868 [Trapa incisa]